ncbi:MAG: SGNH/GDSL hydrolase family protein [Elusimicrobia bacterium]|nr:SGNH/GDSL hydrolase family protein [Elusimicrobiota bacterium]
MKDRGKVWAVLFGAGIALAFVGGAELWLRRAGFKPPPPRSAQAQAAYDQLLRELRQPAYVRFLSPEGEPQWAPTRGADIRHPVVKGERTRRIAVIGESSALKLGYTAEEVFSGAGGETFEVFNLARGGTSLSYVRSRLREALGLQPDVVVLLFGHNLHYRHPSGPWAERLSRLSRRSALAAWATPRDPSRPWFHPRSLPEFEDFLRGAARRLRRRGIPFVVCTVPGNLWVPPDDLSGWLASREGLRALVQRHAQGRRAGVRAVESDPANADRAAAHYVSARWLAEMGDREGAYRRLVLARELDAQGERATLETNALVRRLGERGEFWVLDLERCVRRDSAGGIPGWGEFLDHQHTNDRMNRREAAALGELLRSRLWPRLRAVEAPLGLKPSDIDCYLGFLRGRFSWPDSNFTQALEDVFAQHIDRGAAGAAAVARAARESVLELPGVPAREARALLLFHAGGAFWARGRRAQARELLEAAWRAHPSEPVALRLALWAVEERDLASARRWLRKAPEEGGQAQTVLSWLDGGEPSLVPAESL